MRVSQKVALIASVIVVSAFTVFSLFQYKAVSDALYKQAAETIAEESIVLSHQISNWLNGKLALIDLVANPWIATLAIRVSRKTSMQRY